MQREHALNRFQFHNHFPFNQKIQPAFANGYILIRYPKRNLLLIRNSAEVELSCQCPFVIRFKISGTEPAMHLNTATDDRVGDPVQIRIRFIIFINKRLLSHNHLRISLSVVSVSLWLTFLFLFHPLLRRGAVQGEDELVEGRTIAIQGIAFDFDARRQWALGLRQHHQRSTGQGR